MGTHGLLFHFRGETFLSLRGNSLPHQDTIGCGEEKGTGHRTPVHVQDHGAKG